MKNPDSYDTFSEFCESLDALVGDHGRSIQIARAHAEPFWVVAYDNVPESGSITGFTFGVSSVRHPTWKYGVPELVLSADTTDDDWLISLGSIACELRGVCPFSLGNVLRFGKTLSNESLMSAYFLFWPTILQDDQLQMKLHDRTINFIQAYPVFESEVDSIATYGPEKFFMTESLDFSQVKTRLPSNPSR